MKIKVLLILLATTILFSDSLIAQQSSGYKTPPASIQNLIDAPSLPVVSINGTKDWMLLLERPGYPSIEEVSQPELRIGGLRINPITNGRSRSRTYAGLQLKAIDNGESYTIANLPDQAKIGNVSWSPNGKKIAFTQTTSSGIELWMADTEQKSAKKLSTAQVNATLGSPFVWLNDEVILVKTVIADRGEAPKKSTTPTGPVIQESSGQETTLRTYQDLLKNPYDEALFAYYTASNILKIDLNTGVQTPFGQPGIIRRLSASPDGNYVLVSSVQKPFSYLVPYSRFPTMYDVLNPSGNMVKRVADIPLVEQLPKGFGAVQSGPRSINWRADKGASLYWAEAQDGGDPKKEVPFRDQLFYLDAPFNGEKVAGIPMELRFSGITWGDDDLAIAYESWWPKRRRKISVFKPGQLDSKKQLFDLSTDDRYADPGSFLTTENSYGRSVLLQQDKKTLFLGGRGASANGDRPFLRAFDLSTQKTSELWRSKAPYYESPIEIIDPKKGTAIITRESKDTPPNYYLQNWKNGKRKALTEFEHPYAALKDVKSEEIEYTRADGVKLQGKLYLPAGFDPGKDDPLPVLMWAYPREYKSASHAGQKSGSPYQFVRLSWGSPIYWVTQGYAILNNASMPIIGQGDTEPNDSFRKQLVDNAKAAIDKLVEMDVADPKKVAIGGHSYGAFMTANLLAHSNLFAAGIARSGAYNRTLTPFGFQREERTYWDAPEIYYNMSPFMHANKIDEPLLMIHGQADNNSGTFPIQSERLFQAINGLGGKARLVMLPNESHGYAARESILHTLYEMNQWLDVYVKQRKARP